MWSFSLKVIGNSYIEKCVVEYINKLNNIIT